MVASSGRRLAHLVDDILDFSKLKNHEIVLREQPVAMRELVEVTLSLSRGLVGSRELELPQRRRCRPAAGVSRRGPGAADPAQPDRQRHQVHSRRGGAGLRREWTETGSSSPSPTPESAFPPTSWRRSSSRSSRRTPRPRGSSAAPASALPSHASSSNCMAARSRWNRRSVRARPSLSRLRSGAARSTRPSAGGKGRAARHDPRLHSAFGSAPAPASPVGSDRPWRSPPPGSRISSSRANPSLRRARRFSASTTSQSICRCSRTSFDTRATPSGAPTTASSASRCCARVSCPI